MLAITGRNPRTLLEHERDLMLRDLGGILATFEPVASSFMRSKLIGPDEIRIIRDSHLSEEDKSFEAQALAWLRHHRAMLIGEVVPIAYDYLKGNPQAVQHHLVHSSATFDPQYLLSPVP